jgi:hypothetical protein
MYSPAFAVSAFAGVFDLGHFGDTAGFLAIRSHLRDSFRLYLSGPVMLLMRVAERSDVESFARNLDCLSQ